MNSREKGKRRERQFRDLLREHGFLKAFRGQQYSGAAGNSDVECPELPEIHNEVKGVEKFNLRAAMSQSKADALKLGKIPTVNWKTNGEEWLTILPTNDWLRVLRRSDLTIGNNGETTGQQNT